ncbi:Binds to the 23S rRNA (By similarity) [Seminavis robusta]|uniref:50S ribosomal protein L9, chloroplastic n=1 Tax=Seminavis robusta TaxID=568900 RepID=A0A9N8EKV6_9STRA|nr:Binds to the 23S rRNA (By similarity) [Seminavis robusta]|eukprot:Sro1167_g248350.1 Binds to the 23S rRNA (By similarity) (213) ;mRNA; f:10436-11074
MKRNTTTLLFVLCWMCLACPTTAFLLSQSQTSPPTALAMAKKKGGGGAATKKIQVKMLKDVPGTGQRGAVIMVTPAFFQNKLRPTKSAQIISDEEVAEEESEKAAAEAEEKAEAMAVKEWLEAQVLQIKRKAGPEGHLFGGIGGKVILRELQKSDPSHADFLKSKAVKVVAVTDENGKKMRQDIKILGDFGAQIALAKDIKGAIKISVVPEE